MKTKDFTEKEKEALNYLWMALYGQYSIQGTCKDGLRLVEIYSRPRNENEPLIKATSTRSIEDALVRAGENYRLWSRNEPQIDYTEIVDTKEIQSEHHQSKLDEWLTKDRILQLAKPYTLVIAKINGFWINNAPASKEGVGRSIFEALDSALHSSISKH